MTERSRSRALISAAALFFLLGLTVIAWNIPLPLIAYSPGPVADAVDAVTVDGTRTYESEGALVMLTVAGQEINAYEALLAAVDPAVDVLARNVVRRPDESDEEYRRRSLQLMDQSTATAIAVALDHLDVQQDPQVFITGYAADTPAGQVLEIGDRIVSLDGVPVDDTGQLAGILADAAPGDSVTIEVEREGETRSFQVELVPAPGEAQRPIIGIYVRDLPFWIDVDPGIVGGPSAGMMYTLAIIEALTPGSLSDGAVVAGTGTVDPDGTVGRIGGVRQKVVAAEAAGADYMILPQGNYEDALTAPVEEMELVPVSTVDQALQFLRSLGSP